MVGEQPDHLHLLAADVVQGVGARPLAYELATALFLRGWVMNHGGGLEIALWGDEAALVAFPQAWRRHFPLTPVPRFKKLPPLTGPAPAGFSIQPSSAENPHTLHGLCPDAGLCSDCQREFSDPQNRRCGDPLIGCRHCGPRFALTRALPFDRERTHWSGLPPCPDCQREYVTPGNRRFHSQTINCPRCGPLWRVGPVGAEEEARMFPWPGVTAHLQNGGVLLAQATGGYHLVALADNSQAVALVRAIKHRPAQPLAVMVKDEAAALTLARLSRAERAWLTGWRRPLLLCHRLTPQGRELARCIAPHHGHLLGLMLPATGLQLGLAMGVDAPLVCTSANLHGQPMPLSPRDWPPLPPAVWVAHHNLTFEHATDDTVGQVVAGRAMFLRRSRAEVPRPVRLPRPLAAPTVALGGDLCSTVAVGVGRTAWVSPHLGDQQTPLARQRARHWLTGLLFQLGVSPALVLVDAHPGYHVRALAAEFAAPVREVFHHRAHAAHALAESRQRAGPVLAVVMDGTGYGEDNTPWGAECFLSEDATPGALRRVASVTPVPLVGGEAAVRCPRRWVETWLAGTPPAAGALPARSAGRLFDAAAYVLGLGEENTFEADLPQRLMSTALGHRHLHQTPPLEVDWFEENGLLSLNSLALLRQLRQRFQSGETAPSLAWAFHAALARWTGVVAEKTQARAVVLGGGCFNNRLLIELTKKTLAVPVFWPRRLPPGDGGLAYGQLAGC